MPTKMPSIKMVTVYGIHFGIHRADRAPTVKHIARNRIVKCTPLWCSAYGVSW